MASLNETKHNKFLECVQNLCNYFEENGNTISLKNLSKMKFFSNKKDLNLVLYTMSELGILQKTEEQPPHWEKVPEVQLTDDVKERVKKSVITKLNQRNNSGSNFTIIRSNNVQIGDYNNMSVYSPEELCSKFQDIKLHEK